jgi:hypothetical protein
MLVTTKKQQEERPGDVLVSWCGAQEVVLKYYSKYTWYGVLRRQYTWYGVLYCGYWIQY